MASRLEEGFSESSDTSRLRVALVVPKSDLPLSDFGPPINLGYIASYLRKMVPTVEVKIFDGSIESDPYRSIREFKPNIIGVTATTPQAPAAYKLGDMVKRDMAASVLTVMGGIHATIMPQEAIKHFDVVVSGEGEKVFAQIVQRFQNGEPQKGIVEGEPIDHLDDIPSPSFDLINMRAYLRQEIGLPNMVPPIISMVTSRGCPFHCAFCWNSFRKTKVRYFSAKRIVEEILYLRKEYGVNSIFFLDDEFLINKQRVQELDVLFKQYGLSKWLRWGTQVRATTVTVPLLKQIKAMGCVVLSIGLESGTKRILKYLKAGSATIETNERALKMGQQVGITMGGSFIFGTPTETLDEMKESFRWALNQSGLNFMGISILSPYPGTKVWDLCLKKGLLPEKIDYGRMIQDSSPDLDMYLVTTIPHKDFVRFMNDINKTAWFIGQVRPNRSIKKFARTLFTVTGLKVIFVHPRIVFKELWNLRKPAFHSKNFQNQNN